MDDWRFTYFKGWFLWHVRVYNDAQWGFAGEEHAALTRKQAERKARKVVARA